MHVLMTLVMFYEQTYSNNILSDLCSLDICSFFTAWRIESSLCLIALYIGSLRAICVSRPYG